MRVCGFLVTLFRMVERSRFRRLLPVCCPAGPRGSAAVGFGSCLKAGLPVGGSSRLARRLRAGGRSARGRARCAGVESHGRRTSVNPTHQELSESSPSNRPCVTSAGTPSASRRAARRSALSRVRKWNAYPSSTYTSSIRPKPWRSAPPVESDSIARRIARSLAPEKRRRARRRRPAQRCEELKDCRRDRGARPERRARGTDPGLPGWRAAPPAARG
jgi:hypothetical protein